MADEIVRHDVQALIDGWMQLEREGVQFPVPFDDAWAIAGYARKDSAKRYLPKSSAGKLYHVCVEKSGGRPKDVITLSCDGMKHLCLMADTEEGAVIRQYFIDAENKWKLTQQQHPAIAQEVEILHLKIELAKQEAIRATAEQKSIELRHYVTTALPEPVQQKILGYK